METSAPTITKPQEFSLSAYVADLQNKLHFCKMLHASGVLPASLKSGEAVLAVILKGGELGFSPMASCELFDFIGGRAAPRAQALLALAQSHGGSFKIVKDTETEVTIRATRPSTGYDETMTFGIKDAQKAGLIERSDGWKKYPRDMMWARCVSRLSKRGWADIIGGLPSAEELRDAEAIDITPTPEAERAIEVDASQAVAAQATFGDDQAPTAEPVKSEPAPVVGSEKRYYYDLSTHHKFMFDVEFKAQTIATLKKHNGIEHKENIWSTTKLFNGLKDNEIDPSTLSETKEQ